jgi:hypothetical protein
MMRRFLAWLMSGRLPPIVTAAGLGVVPLLNLPSGAVVGLIALRRGALEGIVAAAGGAALLAALSALIGRSGMLPIVPVAVLWASVIVLALVLRHSRSLKLTIQIATLLGCLAVVAFFVDLGDPSRFWSAVLRANLLPLLDHGGSSIDWHKVIPRMARLMTGVTAAGVVLTTTVAILLARWGQAMLYNPGGLRREFHTLSMGRVATLGASAVFVVSGLIENDAINNLAIVLLVMFMYQGLAVIHATAARRGFHAGWLALFYVLFFLLPLYVLAVVAGLGLVDNWFSMRGSNTGRGH